MGWQSFTLKNTTTDREVLLEILRNHLVGKAVVYCKKNPITQPPWYIPGNGRPTAVRAGWA